ncbi:MAG: hypothetical protein ACYDD6_02730 [Acidimicrobiales bacterium]
MIDSGGFASNPAFQYPSGKTFINQSNGGVPGMDYSTLLPRSVDYVANQTLPQFLEQNLLQFASSPTTYDPTSLTGVGYSNVLDLFYPDQAQRQLTLALLQTLWDRADPNGYASHMTASAEGGLLPDCTGLGVVPVISGAQNCPIGTPDHHVLMPPGEPWPDRPTFRRVARDVPSVIDRRPRAPTPGLPRTSGTRWSGVG